MMVRNDIPLANWAGLLLFVSHILRNERTEEDEVLS